MKKTIRILIAGITIVNVLSCSKGSEPDKVLETGKAVKGDSGYTYKITSGPMEFQWSIKGVNIHVKVKGETTGWIAAGFNPTEGMKDANFIMGFVKDGRVELKNHVGTSKVLHRDITDLGGKDHILNPAGVLKDNKTEISFDYPLNSGEKLFGPINVNSDTILLLAMAQTSFISQQHRFRTKIRVNLSDGSYSILKRSGN